MTFSAVRTKSNGAGRERRKHPQAVYTAPLPMFEVYKVKHQTIDKCVKRWRREMESQEVGLGTQQRSPI